SAAEFAERLIETIARPEAARQRACNGLDFIEQQFGYTAVARCMALDIPELGRLGLGEVRQSSGRGDGGREAVIVPARRRGRTARGIVRAGAWSTTAAVIFAARGPV